MSLEQKLCKSYLGTKTAFDDAERTITAIITTSDVDRDLEVVVPEGIDLAEYERNPVVLMAHRYNENPVGKCISMRRTANGLEATTKFADTERGRECFQLFRDDFLRGFSIGFVPDSKSYGPPTNKELEANKSWRGAARIIRKSRLFEYSVTPIPSNPNAMARAYEAGQLPFLSKGFADDLQITGHKRGKLVPGVVPFTSEKELRRSFKKLIKKLTPAAMFTKEELSELMAERIRVVMEGKVS